MYKNIVSGFIVGLIFLCLGSFGFTFKDLNDYTNSIFVITQDEHTDKINYYEVNYRNNSRTTKKFKSEVDEIFFIGCFERKRKLDPDACKITDEEENEIEITDDLELVLENLEQVRRQHVISGIKLLKVDNEYYVVVTLNVNWWTPYDFYYYNRSTNSLEYIYTFLCEDVVGIKIKEK